MLPTRRVIPTRIEGGGKDRIAWALFGEDWYQLAPMRGDSPIFVHPVTGKTKIISHLEFAMGLTRFDPPLWDLQKVEKNYQQRITIVVEELENGNVKGIGVKHLLLSEKEDTAPDLRWREVRRSIEQKGREAWIDARHTAGRPYTGEE